MSFLLNLKLTLTLCRRRENKLVEFCRIRCADSGIELKGLTTEPGVQFYTGNFLNGTHKGKGATYNRRSAFCLETPLY